MATEIASLYARVGADISSFQRDMKRVKGDLSDAEKTAAAFGNALKLAVGVGVAAMGALAVGIGSSVKAAGSMEQQVANIAAVMKLTSGEVEALNKLILDLGIDPKLKVSAVEAAQAIEMLGRNGLTMTEIMDGAARSTILLANSTGADFATAADLATDVMAMFNIAANDMDRAVDGITGTITSSKFSINDYRLAMAQAGGVASSVGVSFDDFNATIAAISPLFASGSDAGTSFKTFLQRLVPQSDAAKDSMQQLGLEFFNADGTMRGMDEIAGQLSRAFAGLTEEQKINHATTIFGTDAMRAAFGMANAGQAEIARLKEVIGNTSAEEAAATRMNTFAGAVEILKGILESLSIQIGNAFLPYMTGIVKILTEIVSNLSGPVIEWANKFASAVFGLANYLAFALIYGDRMNDWITHLPEKWRKNVEQVWQFVDAGKAMVNRVIEIGKVVMEGLRPLAEVIGKYISWKDALVAVALVLGGVVLSAIGGWIVAMAPVIIMLAKVTAAVAAARWAWQNDLFGIRTTVENTITKINEWWNKYAKQITTTTTSTRTILGHEVSYTLPLFVSQWLGHLAGWARTSIATAQRMFGDFVGAIARWKDETIWAFQAWMWDFRRNFVEPVQEWLGKAAGYFQSAWWRIYNDVGIFIRDFLREWDRFADKWLGWFKPNEWISTGREIIQGLWNGIQQKWNEFSRWLQDKWEWISSGFRKAQEIRSPSRVFAEMGGQLIEGLALGINHSLPMIDAAMSNVNSTVNVAGGKLGGADAGGGDSDLAAAIRALVAVLQQQRAGNQINVTVPAATGDTRSDLAATVQYLQALYA